ncbi:J domain-containing protein [Qipengyuania sp.]|uniref:J domain-containing protein n=1 Tax=Qipengyuania sp. TaxID=2004515 RepID=UPI0035C828B8
MIKLLVLAAVIAMAVRWLTGAWPWDWLSTKPNRAREIAKARRLLRLSPGASREDVRTAYRRLAADAHPDRGGSAPRLAALTQARDLLLDHMPENTR